MVDPSNVKVGDKIYVAEDARPYKVRARDERYIIATKPFNLRHTVLYFIIDLVRKMRGPDNMIFCFGDESDENIADRLKELQSEKIEVSTRRGVFTEMVERIAEGKFNRLHK
jgi:hypothetical protein